MSIVDRETHQLSVRTLLQPRLEMAVADTAAGERYDVWDGTVQGINGRDPQQLNFMLRRLRLGLHATFQDDTRVDLTLAMGPIGAGSDDDGDIEVYEAEIRRRFRDGEREHELGIGLARSRFQRAASVDAANLLFPTRSVMAEHFTGARALGLAYQLQAPGHRFAIDFRETDQEENNLAPADELIPGADNNDFLTTMRWESSFRPDWWTDQAWESHVGQQGFALMLGVDVGIWTLDGTSREPDGAWQMGLDLHLHADRLTADLQFAWRTIDRGPEEETRQTWGLSMQGGYAFALADGQVLEPALRVAVLDLNTDDDRENVLFFAEQAWSGWLIDIGVNWYLNGHGQKLQLALTTYESEGDLIEADIGRLQYQFLF